MSIPPPIVVTCTHARTTELSARVRVQLCRSLSYTRQLAEDMQQCSLAFARDKKLGDLLIIHMAAQLPRSENTLPMHAPKPTASEECSISDNCVK